MLVNRARPPGTAAIVESSLAPSTRDIVRVGLRRASIETVVEVWCQCPPEEATRRYVSRDRHPGPFDATLLEELDQVLVGAEPLGLGETSPFAPISQSTSSNSPS